LHEEKRHHLSDPIATCGDRVYVIGSQNGLFPDSWGGHVPHEMNGVWDHPIKLLDGFWFGVSDTTSVHWLSEATACRAFPAHTEFDYGVGSIQITRRDFVPDGVEGVIVTLTIKNTEPFSPPIELTALFRSDLRPVWLGEQTGMLDGEDTATIQNNIAIFQDSQNPWVCGVASDGVPSRTTTDKNLFGPQRTHGHGTSVQFVYPLSFVDGEAKITFFMAGSAEGERAALATLAQLRAQQAELFALKQNAYAHLIQTSQVTTPDAQLNRALAWVKVNAQWLARSLPSLLRRGVGGEVGEVAVGAGLPEYPWWFGIDTAYAVLPMLQAGQFELVRESLRLLHRASLKRNPTEPGRVIHEMSSNGAVFNEGNAVEVPAFVRAVHQYWQWTGDDEFLRALYPFCKQGVVEYLLGQCDPDGDLCPSGRSIIETLEMHADLEVIDVATYTCEALMRLADMAEHIGESESQTRFLKETWFVIRGLLLTEWWLEDEGLFADIRASKREVNAALQHLADTTAKLNREAAGEAFLQQVKQAHDFFTPGLAQYANEPDDKDLPWLLRHWVVMCPIEVGLATKAQASQALARLQSDEFCNEWGMRLHPNRNDVMSINTGLLALSLARYGHTQDALRMMRTYASTLSYRTPGAICEALPGKWCFVQLWSNLGVTSPTVECFLGIEPDAGRRKLRVVPNLPADWDAVEVQQLRVGGALVNVRAQRERGAITISVNGADAFELTLGAVLREGETPQQFVLNGGAVAWQSEERNVGVCVTCVAKGQATLAVRLATQ
jgi:glycogen debranching enzyme